MKERGNHHEHQLDHIQNCGGMNKTKTSLKPVNTSLYQYFMPSLLVVCEPADNKTQQYIILHHNNAVIFGFDVVPYQHRSPKEYGMGTCSGLSPALCRV